MEHVGLNCWDEHCGKAFFQKRNMLVFVQDLQDFWIGQNRGIYETWKWCVCARAVLTTNTDFLYAMWLTWQQSVLIYTELCTCQNICMQEQTQTQPYTHINSNNKHNRFIDLHMSLISIWSAYYDDWTVFCRNPKNTAFTYELNHFQESFACEKWGIKCDSVHYKDHSLSRCSDEALVYFPE